MQPLEQSAAASATPHTISPRRARRSRRKEKKLINTMSELRVLRVFVVRFAFLSSANLRKPRNLSNAVKHFLGFMFRLNDLPEPAAVPKPVPSPAGAKDARRRRK